MTNLIYRLVFLTSLPLFSLFILMISENTNTDVENYKIEGTLRGVKSNWIYLAHYDTAQKIVKIDSAEVIDEKFNFRGIVTQPEHCYLGMRHISKQGKRQGLILQGEFILDKGTLTVSCQKDSIAKLKATGTKGQNEFFAFKENCTPINLLMNSVYGKIQEAEKNNNKILTSTLKVKYESCLTDIKNLVVKQVKTYPNSIVSAIIAKECFFCNGHRKLNYHF